IHRPLDKQDRARPEPRSQPTQRRRELTICCSPAPRTTVHASSPFPESFLRTPSCNRPNSRVHWRHWTRISSFSAGLRSDQGIAASVLSLKRAERICAPPPRFSPDIARSYECLRSALPKCFCLQVLEAALPLPEIRDVLGQRAPLRNSC